MAHDPLVCGDLIAERRFAYAKAAAEDGDWSAAAEIFEQALERAPRWAAAWFALGEAREKFGDAEAAADAYRSALAADPSDAQGAVARLALIGRGEAPRALPEAYVARLFDDYAPRFEAHLTESLAYRAPTLIADTLDSAAPGRRFAHALDIGCGTGLMGDVLRGRVDRLTGVDLSAAMVAKARERGLYDALTVGEATAFVMDCPRASFDLVAAADSLVYFGDLAPLWAGVATALKPGGLFAFSLETCSLETCEGEGFRLGRSMRFAHSQTYVGQTAATVGLRAATIGRSSSRREAGRDVPGLVCVLARLNLRSIGPAPKEV
jgi:predicted TPR repeat methyltransferase